MANPFSNPGSGAPPAIPARGKAGPGEEAEPQEPERTLMTKQACLIYKIPPQDPVIKFLIQTKAAGWKANDWNLKTPDWRGKMRLVSMGKGAKIKLEDKDTDVLFRECPIETYPGLAIQSVTDSSRYFVIKTTEGGKSVFLGLGFEDRADSFDLQTTLHDYFKGLLVEEQIEQEKEAPPEKLDLALKQGETIKVSINLPSKKKEGRSKSAAARSAVPAPLGPLGSIPAPPSPAMAKLSINARPPPAPNGGSKQWIQF